MPDLGLNKRKKDEKVYNELEVKIRLIAVV